MVRSHSSCNVISDALHLQPLLDGVWESLEDRQSDLGWDSKCADTETAALMCTFLARLSSLWLEKNRVMVGRAG